MVRISQNEAFLFFIIIFLFIKGQLLIKSHHEYNESPLNLRREAAKILFVAYIILLISKVYFPLTIAWGEHVRYIGPIIWLRPIWSLLQVYKGGIDTFIYQIGGNLILLTPLAFFLCYFNEKRYFNIKTILTVCFVSTLFIECSQVILSLVVPNTSRYFEINDIICNTLSGIWGYYAYSLYKDVLKDGNIGKILLRSLDIIKINYKTWRKNQ